MLEQRTQQVRRTHRTRSRLRQVPHQTLRSMAIPATRAAVHIREQVDHSRIMRQRVKCSVRPPKTTRRLLTPVRISLELSFDKYKVYTVASDRWHLFEISLPIFIFDSLTKNRSYVDLYFCYKYYWSCHSNTYTIKLILL